VLILVFGVGALFLLVLGVIVHRVQRAQDKTLGRMSDEWLASHRAGERS
jgi:hypothetical protein